MPRLLLQHGGVTLRSYELKREPLHIGRRSDNEVHLDDPVVSGRHARLSLSASRYLDGHQEAFVEDLESTNGTRVNGRPVRQARLNNGDRILIGRHEFVYEDEPAVDAERTAILLADG